MTDDKQKAEIMNSYFTTIGQSLAEHMESNTNVNSVEYIYGVTPTCQQLEMEEKHFNQQFKDLKPEKATGHDNVTSKELILAYDAVKPGIKSIIRKSIPDKRFPSDYKVARMKSNFKKGEKTDTRNYRPISILSLVSKSLEGQVCKIIDGHLEDNEILNEKQWGFRKRKSTEGLLLNLTENWKQALDEGKVIGVLFVDFKKASDSVNREILKKKTVSMCILR